VATLGPLGAADADFRAVADDSAAVGEMEGDAAVDRDGLGLPAGVVGAVPVSLLGLQAAAAAVLPANAISPAVRRTARRVGVTSGTVFGSGSEFVSDIGPHSRSVLRARERILG